MLPRNSRRLCSYATIVDMNLEEQNFIEKVLIFDEKKGITSLYFSQERVFQQPTPFDVWGVWSVKRCPRLQVNKSHHKYKE